MRIHCACGRLHEFPKVQGQLVEKRCVCLRPIAFRIPYEDCRFRLLEVD